MLTLKDYLELVNYKITEGGAWLSSGYEPGGLYCFSYWDGEQEGASLNCVFSTKTQQVLEVDVCDYKNNRAYRIIDKSSGYTSDKQAWDSVDYIELDTDEDFIEKAQAIIAGEPYDTRISFPIEMNETDLNFLFREAHKQDVTLNQYIERILRNMLAEKL